MFFGYVQFQGSWHRASSQELHSKQSIEAPDMQSPPAPTALPASSSRVSPVKSVLRPERLDSDEESFDTKPLVERSGGSDGIVTTLGSEWEPYRILRDQELAGEGRHLRREWAEGGASHGSPPAS